MSKKQDVSFFQNAYEYLPDKVAYTNLYYIVVMPHYLEGVFHIMFIIYKWERQILEPWLIWPREEQEFSWETEVRIGNMRAALGTIPNHSVLLNRFITIPGYPKESFTKDPWRSLRVCVKCYSRCYWGMGSVLNSVTTRHDYISSCKFSSIHYLIG